MNEGNFTEGYVLGRDSSNGGNEGWGAGGSWIVLIILFAIIFGWGRGGFGGYGNGGGETTINVDSAVQRGFDNQGVNAKLNDIGNGIADATYAINNGINGIQQTLCQGFGGVNTALVQQGYETRLGIQNVQAQMASCCCDITNGMTRGFADLNYNLAKSTCDIIQSSNANTQRLLDYMNAQELSTLRTQLAQAQGQLSQAQQSTTFTNLANNLANNIINTIKPCPTPAYVVPNPYCCTNTCNTCM